MTVRLPRPLLWGPRSGVAAAHPLAVSAGMEILAAGGNAVDAAVAAAAALAVVAPDGCGLGGDALLLVAAPGRAPVAYVGGAALPARPILPFTEYGPASAGVPGAVAAWCAVHDDHGRLPLPDVFAPAAALAAGGFPVSGALAAALERRAGLLGAGASAWAARGARAGATLRQPALAATLEAIRSGGPPGFYAGPVATAIAAAVRAPGGEGIAEDDLAAYAVAAQEPVTGTYGRAGVAVTGPPSQAALAVLALRALEGAPPPGTVAGEHAAIEAVKHAFEHRRALAASGDAAALLAAELPPAPARASALREATGADHTAAVATADADGLVVSMLVSVFHEFGSGVLVQDGGFLLNNRLSGLLADGESPRAAPPAGLRPGHTLSPMLLELDGRRLAIATPGADGQVQTLVQLTRALVDAGTAIPDALAAPRWRSVKGRLAVEASFDADLLAGLAGRGHEVAPRADGDMLFGAAAVAGAGAAGGAVLCAADPRREMWAAVR
jgi:gamma-glutamyltranspeptidase / glutathione hydrolase